MEGKEPTYFVVKNLGATEQADLLKDHMFFNAETRKPEHKDMPVLLVKLFKECCAHIEEDGKQQKITADEFPYNIVQAPVCL